MAQKIWSWIDGDLGSLKGFRRAGRHSRIRGMGISGGSGRLGAGDILARYVSRNNKRGHELLRRISEVFSARGNVYEAYTMKGEVETGTIGSGNYTEHCGGYV